MLDQWDRWNCSRRVAGAATIDTNEPRFWYSLFIVCAQRAFLIFYEDPRETAKKRGAKRKFDGHGSLSSEKTPRENQIREPGNRQNRLCTTTVSWSRHHSPQRKRTRKEWSREKFFIDPYTFTQFLPFSVGGSWSLLFPVIVAFVFQKPIHERNRIFRVCASQCTVPMGNYGDAIGAVIDAIFWQTAPRFNSDFYAVFYTFLAGLSSCNGEQRSMAIAIIRTLAFLIPGQENPARWPHRTIINNLIWLSDPGRAWKRH